MQNTGLISTPALVAIVDDDEDIRGSLDSLLRSAGYGTQTFSAPAEFLAGDQADTASCLILDIQFQGVNGLDFQQSLLESELAIPVILITGHGDIPMTVRGMKAGAVTFLGKPFDEEDMLAAVEEAVSRDRRRREAMRDDEGVRLLYATLTPREREVMSLVAAGLMNKQIAARLELSEITVKIHRGSLMRKMQAQSLADLVRLAETLGVREASTTRFSRV